MSQMALGRAQFNHRWILLHLNFVFKINCMFKSLHIITVSNFDYLNFVFVYGVVQ